MKTKSINAAFVSLFISLTALAGQTNAASECKGLENAACDSNTACSWVGAYERKDGRKINGFCRTSAKGQALKKEQKATEVDS